MTTMSEDSSQGLDHPCPSTISTPYLLPQGLVAPSQAEAKIAALSVKQQHETAKQQRLQQRQEYQIQYCRKLPARRWEEMRAAAESYERKNITTDYEADGEDEEACTSGGSDAGSDAGIAKGDNTGTKISQHAENKRSQEAATARSCRSTDERRPKRQSPTARLSTHHREQFHGQKFKMHIKDCQSGHSNETRPKLLQRIDNEYAEYHQQFYKHQRDDQKKCDEEEGNDISELTRRMKDMSIAQAAQEKVTEVKQDIVEAQASVQDVGDQDGYMDLGEEGTEDGEDWVVVD
ncbi:hypothetical protein D6C86_08613 [Aureobasidium pullulans]|uniref:Uncharacterized protein n=1 Tax=Aureobasidium pullulans TaxID=5580 RepID=A0A4S9VU89_AURPU|nr:hypothetical protein D6C94_09489 [Aureobasidium pullulans]THZ41263.1 hypothetical protein D6C87_05837 [Aureobasidium pullulans]THZ55438.1 hypothetical protein D6C86_08613 [Aureobasidium pullulans]THZ62770.1 hypothetical protein D6C88_08573 [Aureobasidium pullulans]